MRHQIFNPSLDYNLNEETRFVLYNNNKNIFEKKIIIKAKDTLKISFDSLESHLNYKFKFQKKINDKWTDYIPYQRLNIEEHTEDGLKYIFLPNMHSKYLVVVFQAINKKPGYNYIKSINHINTNKLFIKDDYGDDIATRSSYYLGKNRSFNIAENVQKLLQQFESKLNIPRSKFIFCGSSKGGFAALFHGYSFGVGYVLAGGPQILLGDFLNSKSNNSIHPPILDYLAGDRSQPSIQWANELIPNLLKKSTAPYPHTTIHIGTGDPHYKNHVLPFKEMCELLSIENITIETKNYNTHQELAMHFPEFIQNKIESIIDAEN